LVGVAVPVLLVWLIVYSPSEKRIARGAAFLGGVAVAFIPLFLLFFRSPGRVLFGVFQYHMFYRRSEWEGATEHDLELLTSWIQSPQAILLTLLAAAGLWFVANRSGWDRARRAEFYLCGWLAAALGIYLSTPHPTFVQYFMLPVPFLAILAAVGLFGIADHFAAGEAAAAGENATERSATSRRVPVWPVTAVCVLTVLGLVRELYDDRNDYSWPGMEKVARKVNEVTAPNVPIYADENTYFLTGRIPPPGNEYTSSHKLKLTPERAAFVHIIPQAEYDRRIQTGEFPTIETCDEEDWYQDRKLDQLYRHKAEIGNCYVFWDPVRTP